MKTKRPAAYMRAFFVCIFLCMGMFSVPVSAEPAKPSNMLNNCEPYFMSNTSIEDSFVMAGTTYTDGLKFRVAFDRSTQVHFNLGGNYSSVSFDVGHIDGTAAGSSDIVMTVLAEEDQVLQEIPLSNTDIPQNVTIPLAGVKQLSIKWSCRYYDSYFGIGAINFIGSQPSVRIKESNMVHNNEPYAKSNTSIEESFNMGSTTYTGGMKFRVAFDHTTEAHFNFGGNYESMSFEVGHIDGLGAGSSDIVMTILTEGKETIAQIPLSNTAIPKFVEVPLTGVHQLSIKWSCRYYDSYFGIGAINLKSNGVVRGISLDKESIQLSKGNPSAYLQAFVVPSDANNTEVTWQSSNPEIAVVDTNGLVQAISGGTAEITATTVSGGYTATCIVDVDMPISLKDALVALSQESYTYTGSEIKPEVTVTCNGKVLREGTDYSVTYLDNTSVGTAQVVVEGKNSYEGTLRKNFFINEVPRINIADADIRLSQESYTYTGSANTPDVSVVYNGETLQEGNDYRVSYQNHISAGTAQVIIEGINAYQGNIQKDFVINKASQQILTDKKAYTLTAKSGSVPLNVQTTANINYISSDKSIAKVDSSGNVTPLKAGKTTITILTSESENYTAASVKIKITVIPKTVTIKKPKSVASKTVNVTWKKDKTVSGYEIQYSLKKNFSSKKLVTVKNANTVSTKIKKLQKKKTYYIRIRSFVNISSGTIRSNFSKVQTVKTK